MSARVLVVDDILPNVKLLEAKLSSEYYQVMTAMNGKDALAAVKDEQPDLVLLDIMMPGMDGFEVCEKIKSDPETAHIPVVMITALTDSEDRVRGLKAGADDFLSKPINDVALMARVSSLVRLKLTLDELRMREKTATSLGVVDESTSFMEENTDGARVLVVEDRDFEVGKIEAVIEENKSEGVIVGSGAEAIEKATGEEEFDALIVSINLAEEDGLRLCSHLKANERTRNVPIVMIAEDTDIGRVAHGLEIGAQDYVLRPVDRNELLARLRTQIRRKRFQQRLRSSYEVSLSMALTDSLTGLYNRRYLEVHLNKMLQSNERSGKTVGVLMLDIDHFKQVNDTHGHAAGDEVLRVFAERLLEGLRSFDLVARLGGEEFVVVLPDVSEQRAYIVAERLRRMIADKPVVVDKEGKAIDVTTSIGGALIGPGVHDINEVLDRADKSLYEAKEGGRNCIVFEGVGKLDPDIYKVRPRDIDTDADDE